jgi:hypothetical protein
VDVSDATRLVENPTPIKEVAQGVENDDDADEDHQPANAFAGFHRGLDCQRVATTEYAGIVTGFLAMSTEFRVTRLLALRPLP